MYLLYSLLLTVGFLLLMPRFAIDALRSRKYVTGLRQRLGKLPAVAANDRLLIWLHCVSVGETEAARPLVRDLLDRFPSYRLVISTTTVTGQRVARNAFGREAVAVFYFPIDWAWTVRKVLRILQPAAVLIMETELWPNLLRECRRRSIPVVLVNGRISDTSFRRYKLIRPFMRRVLNDLAMALVQSEQDAARICQLGLLNGRVLIPGNLKFDSAETAIDEGLTADIRRRFGFDGTRSLLVAASTHDPEERVALEAFRQVKDSQPGSRARLLIAPRHPERFSEVVSLLQSSRVTWTRRSNQPAPDDATCEVVLLDTIGELRSVYPLADIVFVGGSIAPHGGHNVLEPAVLGVCVVTGAHTQNFAAVTKSLLDEHALVQLPALSIAESSTELASVLIRLLSDEARRHEIGERALAVCKRNRGATERTLQTIAGILAAPTTADDSLPFSTLRATAAK
jgi:3-deoxy-D-manno-octulosonic-acid transferase